MKLDYKIAEHPLRIFEEMAIIEQAVNNQMYDNNQDQPIKKYKYKMSKFCEPGQHAATIKGKNQQW